jgi:hypothetical protein
MAAKLLQRTRIHAHCTDLQCIGRCVIILICLSACGQPRDLSGTQPGTAVSLDSEIDSLKQSPTVVLPHYAYKPRQKIEEARYLKDLQNPNLDAEGRYTLNKKLDMLRREVAERATAMAQPQAPKPSIDTIPPTSTPEYFIPPPPLGIIESTDDVQDWEIIISNRYQEWYDKEKGWMLMAFAGAEQENPGLNPGIEQASRRLLSHATQSRPGPNHRRTQPSADAAS